LAFSILEMSKLRHNAVVGALLGAIRALPAPVRAIRG